MFTVAQIEQAHEKVKSGADFPRYIQEIKEMGVLGFQTWVNDSHTEYFGADNYVTKSEPKYDELTIAETADTDTFVTQLKAHQQGKTDYYTFCKDCAATGMEKWVVNLNKMTCAYYDKAGNETVVEQIPS